MVGLVDLEGSAEQIVDDAERVIASANRGERADRALHERPGLESVAKRVPNVMREHIGRELALRSAATA
jgi:hypothetical protein